MRNLINFSRLFFSSCAVYALPLTNAAQICLLFVTVSDMFDCSSIENVLCYFIVQRELYIIYITYCLPSGFAKGMTDFRSTLYIFELGSSAAIQISFVGQVPKGRKS